MNNLKLIVSIVLFLLSQGTHMMTDTMATLMRPSFRKSLKSIKIENLPLFRRWKATLKQMKVSMSQQIWS